MAKTRIQTVGPAEERLLKRVLASITLVSALLSLILSLTSRDALFILGAVLFVWIFVHIALWAAYDSPRIKARKLRVPLTISAGILLGGAFVYVEAVFWVLLGRLLNFNEDSLSVFVVFAGFTILAGYAYYKILRFGIPRTREGGPPPKVIDPKQSRLGG